MIARALAALVIGMGAVLAGCSADATGARPVRLAVRLDQDTYSLSRDSTAVITLHNSSAVPVYLPMGVYVYYQRAVDGGWAEPQAWFIVDGTGPVFPVPAGGTRTDELPIWFYLRDQPGTYRIQYEVYAGSGPRRLLPLGMRVSRPFSVTP